MTDHDNTRLDALIVERDAGAEAAPQDARPPEFSEEALALDFAAAQAARLRFVAAWNRWMVWDGMRWRTDETRAATDLARPFCRHAASICNWDTLRRALASARTVSAVTTLAATDRRLAATVNEWDADPWALNTPNGVVDLRTGEIRDHDPAERITKVTAVGVGGGDVGHRVHVPAPRVPAPLPAVQQVRLLVTRRFT